ncbi:hypothetical protein [Solibacillus sp. CAU 1738]|uniref:hypothetical protein n=1 Tax=Solibacillus sp. CAU 1738 TaxID=3140363 RepID=UPI003261B939
MRQIFAFETNAEYEKHKEIIEKYNESIEQYKHVLQDNYALNDLPKGIVWTSAELATTFFSNVPIPAFTNRDLIYMSPDVKEWRDFFLQLLEGFHNDAVKEFYENMCAEHVMTIVGHELTHHSDLFPDEFDDEQTDSIWFEEGMCDYIARKHILSEKEFEKIVNVESILVEGFKDKYGHHSLDDFGSGSYENNLTSIMFDYWRSFLSVKYLVEEQAKNNIAEVFQQYHQWHNDGRKIPLTKYFGVGDLFK